MPDFLKQNSITIAHTIRDNFYLQGNAHITSIFLCGADIRDTSTTRFKVAEALSDWLGKIDYDLVFPEDIFDDLLYSRQEDLLSLENLLAESIDVIILIPESPGSFAELGAFANVEKLRNKLVCLIDKKYEKDKSFINKGPIKLVRKISKNRVVYIDPNNIATSMKNIHKAISEVKRSLRSMPSIPSINLLQLGNFLLPTIFVLEPALKGTLIDCIEAVVNDVENSDQIAATALNMMIKKKLIELTPLGYKLTPIGTDSYFRLQSLGGKIKTQDRTVSLDNLRLEILNLQLRNKKLKI